VRLFTRDPGVDVVDDDAVRDRRVQVARSTWTEIPRERLVARGPGLLVDAETDYVYAPFLGATFETGSASLIADKTTGLVFYLDQRGWPVVLERVLAPRTWSQIHERRVRRGAA
jgi:hypothetical protein